MEQQINYLFFIAEGHPPSTMLYKKIVNEGLIDKFKLINITDLIKKGIKIPQAITDVPSIIPYNSNMPISGIHAHTWLNDMKYFNQKTNNYQNKIYHANINEDTSMHNDQSNINADFACIKDADDEKRTKTKFNGANENKSITDFGNIHKQIKENKISTDAQSIELNKLISLRKEQLTKYMQQSNVKTK